LLEIGPPAVAQLVLAREECSDEEARTRIEKLLEELKKQAYAARVEAMQKNLLWEVPVKSGAITSGVVADKKFLFISADNMLHALDAKTGKSMWTFPNVDREFVIDDKSIFISSGKVLRVLDLATGKAQTDFPEVKITAGPAVSGDVIYVGGTGNKLIALNRSTGKEIYSIQLTTRVVYSPAVSDKLVLVVVKDGTVSAHDKKDGKILWTHRPDNSFQIVVPRHITFDGNRIIFRYELGCAALDAKTGKKLWNSLVLPRGAPSDINAKPVRLMWGHKKMKNDNCVPVDGNMPMTMFNGKLHVCASGSLRILDPATGKVTGGLVLHARDALHDRRTHVSGKILFIVGNASPDPLPAVTDRIAYFMTGLGIHACVTKTGEESWLLPIKHLLPSSPVIVDDVMYLTTGSDYFWRLKSPGYKRKSDPKEGYHVRAYRLKPEKN